MKSFAGDVKKELSEINNLSNKNLVRAELMGYLLTNSSKVFSTTSEYNINRYSKLLNNVGVNDFSIMIKGNTFQIKTKNKIEIELEVSNEEEEKALVRGAFLGGGTINNPANIYHLEIVFDEKENAEYIEELINSKDINAKMLTRENKYVVYIVDGENISNFLAFIGASKSVLKFEDVRVVKEVRNNVNRLVNCETANLNKIINSSVKQVEAIKLIKKKKKYKELGENEQQLAELRLKNPNSSLSELARLSTPPLSKSGVNHRMDNILRFAEKLR